MRTRYHGPSEWERAGRPLAIYIWRSGLDWHTLWVSFR